MSQEILEKIFAYIQNEFEEIFVEIDERTPCIQHRTSGEIYPTDYSLLTKEDLTPLKRPMAGILLGVKNLKSLQERYISLQLKVIL